MSKASILISAALAGLALAPASAQPGRAASAPPAASAPASAPAGRPMPQRMRDRHCHDEANRQQLKGQPRRDFMTTCRHPNS